MPRQIHAFDRPERFVAGTVGQPGDRAFFLQARSAGRVVSVALEKAQVAALAEQLGELLDELQRRGVAQAAAGTDNDDTAPLDVPVEEEFRVAALALGWDPEAGQVVIEAQAPTEQEAPAEPLSDAEEGPDVLRVSLAPGAVRAFVLRAQRVVAAGRPPCPLCGLPLEPSGHVCPRQNGRRVP